MRIGRAIVAGLLEGTANAQDQTARNSISAATHGVVDLRWTSFSRALWLAS
ncbi:hypothetical protein M2342_002310 [Sphingobium sp. B8D3A]|nr:hypothetical protein [Sphingobium sp. B8D3A]